MNDTRNPAASSTGAPPQSRTSLHTLLRNLCAAVRTFRPTGEERQAAVDLHPAAGLEPTVDGRTA